MVPLSEARVLLLFFFLLTPSSTNYNQNCADADALVQVTDNGNLLISPTTNNYDGEEKGLTSSSSSTASSSSQVRVANGPLQNAIDLDTLIHAASQAVQSARDEISSLGSGYLTDPTFLAASVLAATKTSCGVPIPSSNRTGSTITLGLTPGGGIFSVKKISAPSSSFIKELLPIFIDGAQYVVGGGGDGGDAGLVFGMNASAASSYYNDPNLRPSNSFFSLLAPFPNRDSVSSWKILWLDSSSHNTTTTPSSSSTSSSQPSSFLPILVPTAASPTLGEGVTLLTWHPLVSTFVPLQRIFNISGPLLWEAISAGSTATTHQQQNFLLVGNALSLLPTAVKAQLAPTMRGESLDGSISLFRYLDDPLNGSKFKLVGSFPSSLSGGSSSGDGDGDGDGGNPPADLCVAARNSSLVGLQSFQWDSSLYVVLMLSASNRICVYNVSMLAEVQDETTLKTTSFPPASSTVLLDPSQYAPLTSFLMAQASFSSSPPHFMMTKENSPSPNKSGIYFAQVFAETTNAARAYLAVFKFTSTNQSFSLHQYLPLSSLTFEKFPDTLWTPSNLTSLHMNFFEAFTHRYLAISGFLSGVLILRQTDGGLYEPFQVILSALDAGSRAIVSTNFLSIGPLGFLTLLPLNGSSPLVWEWALSQHCQRDASVLF